MLIALTLTVLSLACLANAAASALCIMGMRVLARRIMDLEAQPAGIERTAHVDLEERVAKLESPPPPKPKRTRAAGKKSTSAGLGEAETPVV